MFLIYENMHLVNYTCFLGFAETLLAVFGPFGQMEQDEIPGGKWYKFG